MWVKICGVTDATTAEAIAAAGADAIGVNFYARSVRCVDVAAAAEIVRRIPDRVEAVGVFVNADTQKMLQTTARCGLRTVQLHGDEPPEQAAELVAAGLRVIRAFRVGAAGLAEVETELSRLRALGVELRGCLIDARVAGSYGGTGVTPPWELIREGWRRDDWPPLILAGGLTPQNVAAGICACRPWGVDVAGGVESAPGVKNLREVERFIENARGAS